MARDLGSLLDLEAPEGEESKNEVKKEEPAQPKAEIKTEPKSEKTGIAEPPAGGRSSLISDATTLDVTQQTKEVPWSDFLTGAGTAAGAYAGKKFYNGFVLPSQVRNTALSLGLTNKALQGLHLKHADAVSQLEDAKSLFDYLHSDQALIDHLPPHLQPPTTPASPLTVIGQPEAISNYQLKHIQPGFTPPEGGPAMGASASDVQQRLLPSQQRAMLRAESIMPGTQRIAEAGGLALTPEQIKERAAMLEARNRSIELEKQKIHGKMEPQRAKAAAELTRAQEAVDASEIALRDLQNRQAAQGQRLASQTSELSPGMQRVAGAVGAESGIMPQIIKAGSRLLGKIAVPAAVASVPFEAQAAYDAAKRGEYLQALKHGVGAGSGALVGAAPLALALGAAPAVATVLGVAGTIGGLGVLASDVPDIYRSLKGKVEDYWNR